MSVILETGRLLLRPPRAADISHFVPLLKDFDVAKNLSKVPHPYTEDDACAFLVSAAHGWRSREEGGRQARKQRNDVAQNEERQSWTERRKSKRQ